MNNIFNKNLQALAQKNITLAKKLLDYQETDVPQIVQENGMYNFSYKNRPLHNPQNPLGEAIEIFTSSKNTPVSIHLIFGIGLGYLFQVASVNSKGTVILYEQDLNILKTAFKLVDFSENIKKNNVLLTDNLEELCQYIYQKSNTKNSPLMLSTTAYRELYGTKFDELVIYLQRQIGSYNLDRKYTEEKFSMLTQRLFSNIPILVKETPLAVLKDFYKGKTAVVVSAGPTLDRNLETIKKYRDKMVLIVVGTAMKALSQHQIKPDFLTIIETNDCSKQVEGVDLSDINFITEPISHPRLRKLNFKNIYTHVAFNNPINVLWSKIAGIDTSEYLSKGTVSYTALNAARILGCSKIILVGQDLAYIEGQCYSKNSAYKDLECKYNNDTNRFEITAKDFKSFSASLCNSADVNIQKKAAENRLKNLNASLYYVKGIKGEMLPTESVYATFIQPLTEFTRLFPECTYINTSLEGAQIDGFENLPLEEALQGSLPVETRTIKTDYNYDINIINSKLSDELNVLSQLKLKLEQLNNSIKNFNNDFKRYKNATVEVLKSLKKVFVQYSEFSSKDAIFDLIMASETISMDYEMKMTHEFTPSALSNISKKMESFSTKAESGINTMQQIIQKTIECIGDKT